MSQNLVAAALYIPVLILFSVFGGMQGSAFCYLILQSVLFVSGTHFFHKHALKQEKMRWYWDDVGYPTSVITGFLILTSFFFPSKAAKLVQFGYLAFVGLGALVVGVLSQKALRSACFLALKPREQTKEA